MEAKVSLIEFRWKGRATDGPCCRITILKVAGHQTKLDKCRLCARPTCTFERRTSVMQSLTRNETDNCNSPTDVCIFDKRSASDSTSVSCTKFVPRNGAALFRETNARLFSRFISRREKVAWKVFDIFHCDRLEKRLLQIVANCGNLFY